MHTLPEVKVGCDGPAMAEQKSRIPDAATVQGADNLAAAKQGSNQSIVPESSNGMLPPASKRGGPRTPAGKESSKRNALKLGLFAKAVVLNFESRSEFDALLRGLRDDLKPEGMLEETLVMKLATILWRWRRLLLAERGEVQKSIQSLEFEQARRADERFELEGEIDAHLARTDVRGLIPDIEDPEILESCLERLLDAKNGLERFGFSDDTLWIPLARVYGAREKNRSRDDFYNFYNKCVFFFFRASEEERKKAGFASQQDCLTSCIARLDQEIQRLESLRKEPRHKQEPPPKQEPRHKQLSSHLNLHLRESEFLRQTLPANQDLDRLQRYEGHLERVFDRTLSQLERFQRIRHGFPPVPTINVRTSE